MENAFLENSMARMEYRVGAIRGDGPGQMEDELNSSLKKLSEEGWRFVETIYAQNSAPLLLVKKPVKTGVSGEDEKPAGASKPKTARSAGR